MSYRKMSGLAMLLLCVALTACSTQQESKKLSVVTSIRPLALMVEQLAGDTVQVQTLLPANADPHNMALRISERSRLDQADLVVWLGPDFEQFLQKPMASRSADAQLVLGGIAHLHWPSEQHAHHDGHGPDDSEGRDMHLWLNPDNAKLAMRAIYRRLVALQPELEAQLSTRLTEALRAVDVAQRQIQRQLDPVAERGFGVDHNAYAHFVTAFGLNQMAAVNDVPGQSMSAKQRHQLHQQLDGAACFIVERKGQTNERLAAALNLPVVVADPLASNPELETYSDFLLNIGNAFYRCLEGQQEM